MGEEQIFSELHQLDHSQLHGVIKNSPAVEKVTTNNRTQICNQAGSVAIASPRVAGRFDSPMVSDPHSSQDIDYLADDTLGSRMFRCKPDL